MTLDDDSQEARIEAAMRELGRRRTRFFLVFAGIQTLVMLMIVIPVYLLEPGPADSGLIALAIVTLVGVTVMVLVLRVQSRAYLDEIAG